MAEDEHRQRQKAVAGHCGVEVGGCWHHKHKAAHACQRAGNGNARVAHPVYVHAHAVRRLRVFAARAQPQAKARFVQHHSRYRQHRKAQIGGDIGILEQQRPQHGNIAQHRYLGDAEGVGERDLLHAADHTGGKNSECRSEHVDGRAADDLIRLHIDGCICMRHGDQHAHRRRDKHRQQEQQLGRQGRAAALHDVDEQDAGKRTHDHDAFQRDIDDAAALTEHPAQRHDQQRNGEEHRLLYQKIYGIHSAPPPSCGPLPETAGLPSAARFSSLRLTRRSTKPRKSSEKAAK